MYTPELRPARHPQWGPLQSWATKRPVQPSSSPFPWQPGQTSLRETNQVGVVASTHGGLTALRAVHISTPLNLPKAEGAASYYYPHLWVKKRRHREVKQSAQGHPAKWQHSDSGASLTLKGTVSLPTTICLTQICQASNSNQSFKMTTYDTGQGSCG